MACPAEDGLLLHKAVGLGLLTCGSHDARVIPQTVRIPDVMLLLARESVAKARRHAGQKSGRVSILTMVDLAQLVNAEGLTVGQLHEVLQIQKEGTRLACGGVAAAFA